MGPESAGWGGDLPREGVGVEKFVPSLESLSSLGFEGRNCGGAKQGRFVILRFPLFYSVSESQATQILGKTARNVSLSHPLLCAPNASKD